MGKKPWHSMRALFICSRNRLRSPTAEALFSSWPDVETDSAGLAPDAALLISIEQVLWADMIFVMERAHKARLSKKFGTSLKSKQIICLDIPDKYTFMQPELVAILERTAGKYLRRH